MQTKSLTIKQRLFVEAYLETLNATEAARRAGYKAKDDNSFGAIGAENLRILKIRTLIDERLNKAAMSADEVLYRLTQQGRVSIGFFFLYEVGDGGKQQAAGIDWEKVKSHGHLVKSITWTRFGPKLELHDGQAATVWMGKAHSLFREIQEHEGEVVLKVVYGNDGTGDQAAQAAQPPGDSKAQPSEA